MPDSVPSLASRKPIPFQSFRVSSALEYIRLGFGGYSFGSRLTQTHHQAYRQALRSGGG